MHKIQILFIHKERNLYNFLLKKENLRSQNNQNNQIFKLKIGIVKSKSARRTEK